MSNEKIPQDMLACDRLEQAFKRGYQACCVAIEGDSHLPYGAILQAAVFESQEIRRTIDSCRDALGQASELPESEQLNLRHEVKATLEPLLSTSEKLLDRLTSLTTTPVKSPPTVTKAQKGVRSAHSRQQKKRGGKRL